MNDKVIQAMDYHEELLQHLTECAEGSELEAGKRLLLGAEALLEVSKKEVKANALVVPPSPKRNGLNQDWFDRMSLEEKHAYRARRPKTKFVKSDQLHAP